MFYSFLPFSSQSLEDTASPFSARHVFHITLSLSLSLSWVNAEVSQTKRRVTLKYIQEAVSGCSKGLAECFKNGHQSDTAVAMLTKQTKDAKGNCWKTFYNNLTSQTAALLSDQPYI